MSKKLLGGVGLSWALPFVLFAQTVDTSSGVFSFIKSLINLVIPVLIAIAVLYFLWNVLNFLLSAGDAAKRKDSLVGIAYGILIIFVMVSIFGLVGLLSDTFSFTNTPLDPPQVDF